MTNSLDCWPGQRSQSQARVVTCASNQWLIEFTAYPAACWIQASTLILQLVETGKNILTGHKAKFSGCRTTWERQKTTMAIAGISRKQEDSQQVFPTVAFPKQLAPQMFFPANLKLENEEESHHSFFSQTLQAGRDLGDGGGDYPQCQSPRHP